jgi:hypothetical protein
MSDCVVKLVSSKWGNLYGYQQFQVDYIDSFEFQSISTEKRIELSLNKYPWTTEIVYKIRARFAAASDIPPSIEMNEFFYDYQHHTPAGATNNWTMADPGAGPTPCLPMRDYISPGGAAPHAISGGKEDDFTKVDSWGGIWYLGSSVRGEGKEVLNKRWVRYLGHGAHE